MQNMIFKDFAKQLIYVLRNVRMTVQISIKCFFHSYIYILSWLSLLISLHVCCIVYICVNVLSFVSLIVLTLTQGINTNQSPSTRHITYPLLSWALFSTCMMRSRHWYMRISAIAEEPRDAPRQLKSYQLMHSCTKTHTWKGLQWVNDLEKFKVTQGRWNCRYSIDHISFSVIGL